MPPLSLRAVRSELFPGTGSNATARMTLAPVSEDWYPDVVERQDTMGIIKQIN
jgi:hypothetical protein